jgi:hypothetical protein
MVFSVGVFAYMYQSDMPENAASISGFVLLSAFLVSYLMVPKIMIKDKSILLKNTFTTLTILANNIRTVETYPLIGFNVRTMGVGGIFGFFGYFNWGEVWYVTNIYKKVKIVMNTGKVYMISVENPVVFVEEIKNLMQS